MVETDTPRFLSGPERFKDNEQVRAEKLADLIAIQSRGQTEPLEDPITAGLIGVDANRRNAMWAITMGKTPDDYHLGAEVHSLSDRRQTTASLGNLAVNEPTLEPRPLRREHSAAA